MTPKAPIRWQTAIFSTLVSDFMRQVPPQAPAETTCGDVIAQMRAERASSVTIVDERGRPIGIVTEQDVTRRVVFQHAEETPVAAVMTVPVRTISAEEYLFHAIAHMRRRDLRHMPVVDGDGVLAGMLNLHDALAVAGGRLMGRIEALTDEGTIESLRKIKQSQVGIAEEMLEDHLPAHEVQGFITRVNNDIYWRIVNLALQDMAADGWGKPPVRFSVIVMGSGGRGENYLYPDQDNGFILADYPDSEHNRIDKYFIELAERMTSALDTVGLPYCNGYCMAVNPLWRKTLSQWIQQINLWGRKRSFVAIRLADIFFDFQPVWGDDDLAAQLRTAVTRTVQANFPFLQEMYAEERDHNVALGMFGQLVVEKGKKNKGKVNLKHAGTVPLVEAVRLMALREGIPETSTLGRMEALHAAGVLDDAHFEDLSAGFKLLCDVLLRRQISEFRAGKKVNYHVNPKKLPKRTRKHLVEALKAIDELRDRVRAEFTAEIF